MPSDSQRLFPGGSSSRRLYGYHEAPTEASYEFNIIGDGAHATDKLKDSSQYERLASDRDLKIAALGLKDDGSARMWNSIWLHPVVLIGFTALFAALFVTIIVLYDVSEVHHGLNAQVQSNRYSWTYGPTAGESSPVPVGLYL